MAGLLDFLGGQDMELRNNKQVGPAAKDVTGRGYRIPDAALEGPKGAATQVASRGLLGGLGAAAGAYDLVTGANEKYGTGAWDRAQDIANKRDVRLAVEADPGLPQRGIDTVGRVTGNAMEGVRGLMEQARAGEQKEADNRVAMPMEPAKKAEAAMAAAQDPAIEAGRQRIQDGALKGLQSGEVHVSDLAKGVVQADAQRAGKQLSPEEEKTAVAGEITAMKTMDKSQLSQYVSYALIAGGLLASFFDKSGQAGRNFHDSFNKQLDRNLAAGKMSAQQQQAAAKLALEERKVDINETDVESKIGDRTAGRKLQERGLDQGDTKIGILGRNADTAAYSAQSQAALGKARLGLMAEGNRIKEKDVDAKAAARVAKAEEDKTKGVPLTFKDSSSVVKDVYKSKGVTVDPTMQTQIAGRLPTLQKQYPQLSVSELVELAEGEYDVERTGNTNYWNNQEIRIRQPK